jgi:hypothetical protein
MENAASRAVIRKIVKSAPNMTGLPPQWQERSMQFQCRHSLAALAMRVGQPLVQVGCRLNGL